jgi:peptidyl-prolyl cis-trans isomerase C
MKPLSFLFFISVLYIVTVAAAESTDEDILAQRGKGVVTQKSFSARADKIPAAMRRATLRDGNRLRDLINNLLLQAQLAQDARDAGYDKGEMVQERMRLAAEAELGEAWLQYYVETQPEADYEALARENYQLNQGNMLSSAKLDVSQILISTKERSVAEAKELAATIYQKLKADPASFDNLVLKYSEDPSVSSNQGKFTGVKKGDMVKPFEEVAFALSEGEISAPVETRYGFHIIRLDALFTPTKLKFDEVKARLIKTERERHRGRIRQDYLSSLASPDTIMTKEALQEMVRRQFSEDYAEPTVDGTESE